MDWLPHPRCCMGFLVGRSTLCTFLDSSLCYLSLRFHGFRCIIFSCDDGTMKLLSLVRAAYDSNLEGKPSAGPKTGLNVFNFSSSSIWSIQVSKLTGFSSSYLTSTIEHWSNTRMYNLHFLCAHLVTNSSQSWHVHGKLLLRSCRSKSIIELLSLSLSSLLLCN